MTVRTWNRIVGFSILAQSLGCMLAIILCNSVSAQAAALLWMCIGIPCTFGFLLNEEEGR